MAEPAKNSRALRSRDLWPEGHKKEIRMPIKIRTQPIRKNTRSGSSGKIAKDAGNASSSISENQGRFRSKLTDTLKLKLIAQPPRNANHKKTPAKPTPKTVTKKTPPKNSLEPVTPVVKPDIATPPLPGAPMGLNGLSVVNNHHMPKSYLLYVSNLPTDITRQQLEDHFRKTGGVKNIRIPKEKGTEKGKGYAYVELKDRISHGIGLRLHQTKLAGGRRINVEFTQVRGKQKGKLKRRIQALGKAAQKSPEKT